jgi:hypothetical protein
MQLLPLIFRDGHLFVTIGDHDWLLDTGAPTSFGNILSQAVGNRLFRFPESYMGLTATKLAEFVGHPTAGVMGADVLNNFDILIDVPNRQVSFAEAQLELDGVAINTDEFMGLPIIQANINGIARRMFFDTGARISYFQDDSLAGFPPAGSVTDFYPGVGQFQTDTHEVQVTLGCISFTLRCGSLPGLLGATLMMADTEGIIGNAVLLNRKIGYFPRRQQLVL